MRAVVKSVLTAEEAEDLIKDSLNKSFKFSKNTPKSLEKILNSILNIVDLKVQKESYWRIEKTQPFGHDWHLDTGNGNHMLWCKYGGTVLLTEHGNGGYLKYRKNGVEELIKNREQFDLYFHSMPVN